MQNTYGNVFLLNVAKSFFVVVLILADDFPFSIFQTATNLKTAAQISICVCVLCYFPFFCAQNPSAVVDFACIYFSQLQLSVYAPGKKSNWYIFFPSFSHQLWCIYTHQLQLLKLVPIRSPIRNHSLRKSNFNARSI